MKITYFIYHILYFPITSHLKPFTIIQYVGHVKNNKTKNFLHSNLDVLYL